MDFTFEPTEIPDVVLVTHDSVEDERGSFAERYRRSAFRSAGITQDFVQDNLARSAEGVLRGLHYQLPPVAQGKLVGVLRGEIFDVAVDLRQDAPTFGRWVGRRLTADGREQLWVPPGFAHGYAVLGEGADVVYKVTAEYDAGRERGLRWDDPSVRVAWPLDRPLLSDKDRQLPGLADADLPSTSGGGA